MVWLFLGKLQLRSPYIASSIKIVRITNDYELLSLLFQPTFTSRA
ncbi:hypothetical protein [Calothrix sp. UHCC 0171]|nr:hypothetical protein [Calothrix sp. UHCC 0171]MEA5570209.1 hypothetical protein [Calothrix sp. UHCC 0171]